MCKVAKETKTILTVRKAGKHTIEKLALGYPTKGHDILDKTLKPATLKDLNKTQSFSKAFTQLFFSKIG